MPYNKGFRVFNLHWVVSSISTSGSTYENDDPTSGRINNSNSTYGYTDDKYGVKRCLEDFCAPLFSTELNGNGWQLDTTLCPNNEAILLPPNNRVYVLFFIHTSGARLMMGLNYFGMNSYTMFPGVDPPNYSNNSYTYCDIGFLSSKTNYIYPLSDTNPASSCVGGGIFMSMIPPANSGDPQDVFNPTVSVRDLAFYPQTMLPVMYQCLYANAAQPGTSNYKNYTSVCSFIKQGTNDTTTSQATTYTNAKAYGVCVGRNVKLSLLVCEEVIGILGWYNNSIWIGGNIIGKVLSNCRHSNDTLCTADYGELAFTSGLYPAGSGNGYYIWNGANNYYQICRCCNVTGTNWPNMFVGFDRNGWVDNPDTFEYIYAGHVNGNCPENQVSTNGQIKATLRSDLFRFTPDSSNKTFGQTYNDGNWCCFRKPSLNTNYQNSISDNTLGDMLLIKWDGAANGNNSISG